MAVRYYEILAWVASSPSQAQWLGQTSDLSFKTEVDKSIDCDDGTTAVGSEKLSCSFSVLEKLERGLRIKKLWLVPVSGSGEIIELNCDSEDIQINNKSGEFEQSKVSISVRYAVDAPAYQYIGNYWDNFAIFLIRYGIDLAGLASANVTGVKAIQATVQKAIALKADCVVPLRIALVNIPRNIITDLAATGEAPVPVFGSLPANTVTAIVRLNI